MTQPEFDAWLANSIKDYAQDKVQAGAWAADEALQRSREEHEKLLPAGLASPDNYLYSMWNDDAPLDTPVGVLWIARPAWKRTMAFIYDIIVFEPYRRRGYGRQAMLALEDKVRALGLDSIGLHVFGHNPGALALYQQVGYNITDINMEKRL